MNFGDQPDRTADISVEMLSLRRVGAHFVATIAWTIGATAKTRAFTRTASYEAAALSVIIGSCPTIWRGALSLCRHHSRRQFKAFSGKVGTGFPSENASNQKLTAGPRFNKSGTCCNKSAKTSGHRPCLCYLSFGRRLQAPLSDGRENPDDSWLHVPVAGNVLHGGRLRLMHVRVGKWLLSATALWALASIAFLALLLTGSVTGYTLDPRRSIQQFKHNSWTVENDAPTPVFALAQDRRGFLWLGARDGLFRFADRFLFAPYRR